MCVHVLNYHWVKIFKYKYNTGIYSTTLVSQIGAVYFGTLFYYFCKLFQEYSFTYDM